MRPWRTAPRTDDPQSQQPDAEQHQRAGFRHRLVEKYPHRDLAHVDGQAAGEREVVGTEWRAVDDAADAVFQQVGTEIRIARDPVVDVLQPWAHGQLEGRVEGRE